MTNSPPNFTTGAGLPSTIRSYIIGRQETLDALLQDPGSPLHDIAQLCPMENSEKVPVEILDAAQCLFLEIAPDDPGSMRRFDNVRQLRPELPLIAMISAPEFQLTRLLIRQGVHDVVSLPLKAEDIISSIMDVGVEAVDAPDRLAPVVALASPTGGIGATTIITHLGTALSRIPGGKRCCIVDLDIQFGDVASYFGLMAKISVTDLLEAGERTDNIMVRDAAIDTNRGPFVIAAPQEISPLEEVSVDKVLKLLRICREEFDIVLLDLPSNWTNWVLSVALSCQHIMVMTEPSLHSIRRAKRCLDMFNAVGRGAEHVSLVVNRNEKRLFREIDVDDVAKTLHREAIGVIPLEKRTISKAQDQGLLLQEVSRNSQFENAIADLAAQLLGKVGGVNQ